MDSIRPQLALYIVEQALRDKLLSPSLIRQYEARLQEEIAELEDKLMRLGGGALVTSAPAILASPEEPFSERIPRRARKPPTTAAKASYEVQARYIRALKQIPSSRRAKYKNMAQRKGREAAIAAIESLGQVAN